MYNVINSLNYIVGRVEHVIIQNFFKFSLFTGLCTLRFMSYVIFYRYRPNLAVEYITKVLGFASDDECCNFLSGREVVFSNQERTAIDCKSTYDKLSIKQ